MQRSIDKLFYLCSKAKKLIDKRVEDFGAQYVAFGIFGAINYPASYFMWHNINTQAYESLTLRLIASFLCIPLALKNYWPVKLRTYLSIYWYLVVLYSLPFFGGFMLLKNHISQAWLMNDVIGFFLLVLIVDWLSFIFLLVLGVALGWLCYYLTDNSLSYYTASTDISLAIYMYIFAIVIGGIFSRNRQKLQKEKIDGMMAVGGSIAHELRNPLLAINTMVSGVKRYFPKLLSGYHKADAHNLLTQEEKIRLDRFEALLTIVEDINAVILPQINSHTYATILV